MNSAGTLAAAVAIKAKGRLLDYPNGVMTAAGLIVVVVVAVAIGWSAEFGVCLPGDAWYCAGKVLAASWTTLTGAGRVLDVDSAPAWANWARWTAVGGVLIGAASVAMRRAQPRLNALLLDRWLSPTIVVCDDLPGVRAATELARKRCVLTLLDADDDRLRTALDQHRIAYAASGERMHGVLSAGAVRAGRELWLLCADSERNTTALAEAGSREFSGATAPAVVRVEGFWLRQQLQDRLGAASTDRRNFASVRIVSAAANRARAMLAACPPNYVLDANAATAGRYWVVGTSEMALELMMLLARLAHSRYAASIGITVIGPAASRLVPDAFRRSPALRELVAVETVELGVQYPESAEELAASPTGRGELPAIVYVCIEDRDAACAWRNNLLRACLRSGRVPPVVQVLDPVTTPEQALLASRSATANLETQPLSFTDVSDEMARLLHERYLAEQSARGAVPDQRAAIRPWHELPFDLQEENRAAAAHIFIKLRDLFAVATPQISPAAGDTHWISDEELGALAEVEHRRWVTGRAALGWQHAEVRDDMRRLHPSLVSWNLLATEEKQKDFDVVRSLPTMLGAAGLALQRRTPVLLRLSSGARLTSQQQIERLAERIRRATDAMPQALPLVVVNSAAVVSATRQVFRENGARIGLALTQDSLAGDLLDPTGAANVWDSHGAWCIVRADQLHARELADRYGWTLRDEDIDT